MKRVELLEKAKEVVTGERVDIYGNPEDNFKEIAEYWSLYLGKKITPQDVAILMIFLKIARIKTGQDHIDNFIDIAGYSACAVEMV